MAAMRVGSNPAPIWFGTTMRGRGPDQKVLPVRGGRISPINNEDITETCCDGTTGNDALG
jgi:hypothetical protein